MRKTILALVSELLLFASVGIAQTHFGATAPSNDEIHKMLAEWIGRRRPNIGIVVGVVEPAGRRIASDGNFDDSDRRRVDGNTVFEIGAIMETFTSLLLADMARRGEIELSNPVSNYAPKGG